MKTQDENNEFYLYSFTCQFLVWMQRPDRRALGASAKPIREVQDQRPSVPENGMLAPQTCIRRMCTCTSGLVIPQFRKVHNKIRWLLQRQINQTLKLTSFQQSMELLTRDQCTPLLKFTFSMEIQAAVIKNISSTEKENTISQKRNDRQLTACLKRWSTDIETKEEQ